MAIPAEMPLLEDHVGDAVDHRGLPAGRSTTGGWRSAWFIIGVEVAERFAYYGIGSNLISYLTGPLGESTASAAANVNAWSGTGLLLPVLGAFISDAFLGRFHTVLVASLIYVLGLALLTLSALLIPISPSTDENSDTAMAVVTSQSSMVNALFFFSLYMVAIGQSGHKPCVQAFGADQFDGEDLKEKRSRSSFFNWWYLSFSAGISLAVLVVVYVQDNVNWAVGFGIPCLVMVFSLVVFLLGRRTYRYTKRGHDEDNAFTRIGRVLVVSFKNRRLSFTRPGQAQGRTEMEADPSQRHSEKLGFLHKALLSPHDSVEDARPCSIRDVEDAMDLIRLVPIWFTTLAYAIPYAQYTTFFTKQGVTMNRKISPGVEIPPASLQILIGISIILIVPIFDRVFVPIARSITKIPRGITMLQRIGAGMVLSALTMVISALVESKRLETAKEHGLIDLPDTTIPMSIYWLVPQYLLLGLADVFTLVGMQEFFYSQVPTELRSIGLALYLSALGVGSFLSSFLIYAIDSITGKDAGKSWFDNNLNRAHLDYFYWLLAALSAVGFSAFLLCSRSYAYRHLESLFSV